MIKGERTIPASLRMPSRTISNGRRGKLAALIRTVASGKSRSRSGGAPAVPALKGLMLCSLNGCLQLLFISDALGLELPAELSDEIRQCGLTLPFDSYLGCGDEHALVSGSQRCVVRGPDSESLP